MKKLIAFFLAVLFVFGSFGSIFAGTVTEHEKPKKTEITEPTRAVYSGTCGADLTWTLDTATGLLEITGTGYMTNLSSSSVPWYSYRSSIKTVVIGSGVTSIGGHAFSHCNSLTSVTIPGSVTSICDYAFYSCGRLTSVTIGNGVTIIGNHAFYGCSSLTSVIIPDSVTSIYGYAFRGCSSLTSAVFLGAPPSSFGSYVFDSCAPNFCIYYTSAHASEWAPNGETSWRGYTIKMLGYSISQQMIDCDHRYIGVFESKTLKRIEGVSVTLTAPDGTSETGETNDKGIACFEIMDADYYSVKVMCDGLTLKNAPCVKLEKGRITELSVNIESALSGISDVYYGVIKENYNSTGLKYSNMIDLLCREIKIAVNSDKQFDVIICGSLDESEILEYQLLANGNIKMTSPNGVFTVRPSDFEVGEAIWARIKTKGGFTQPLELGLRMIDLAVAIPTGGNFELMKNKLSFTVPEDIMLLGGSRITLDLGYVPIMAYIKDDTYRIGIGTNNLFDPADDVMFNKLKTGVLKSEYKKGINAFLDASENGIASIGSEFKPKLMVYGYIEGSVSGSKPSSGCLRIIASAKIGNEWQVFPFNIPVVIKGSMEAGLDDATSLAIDLDPFAIRAKNKLELILPKVRLSCGVGVASCFDISVYGEGENRVKFSTETGFIGGNLKGEIGVSAKFFLFEEQWPIISGNMPYGNYYKSNDKCFDPGDVYKHDSYSLTPRTYLASQSAWLGGLAKRDLLTARQTVTLQEGVYGAAEPQIVNANGHTVMAWLADDGSRSTGNHSMLVWSEQNADGTWTEPEPVWDDGTGDFEPSLVSDGSNIYIAWMDANAVFDETVTLEDLSAACEISCARFDFEHGFTDQRRLTSDNYLDMQPCVAFENGAAYVVWSRNDNNDVLSMNGTNRIMYAPVNGQTAELTTVSDPVNWLAAGELDNALNICWAADTDGDLETLEDTELFIRGLNGNTIRLTNNEVSDSIPSFANVNGEDKLFFVSDGALMSWDGAAFHEEGLDISGEYSVVTGGDTAYVMNAVGLGESAQLFISKLNDQGEWDEAIVLTDTEGYAETPAAVVNSEGGLTAVYIRTDATVTEDDVITSSDLCCITMRPSYNLTLNGVEFDAEAAAPGAVLPVTLSVTNNGELPVDSFTAMIGDMSYTINEVIASGETKEFEIEHILPASVGTGKLTFTIEPSETDFDTEDNTLTKRVYYPGLNIELHKLVSGDASMVLAAVANNGFIDTNATVTVRRDSSDGEILAEIPMGAIPANTLKTLELTGDYLKYMMTGSDCLYFSVEASEDELFLGDNDDFIVIYEADTAEYTAPVITNVEYPESAECGGTAEIAAEVVCTYDEPEVTLMYSVDGGEEQTISMILDNGLYTASINIPASASEIIFHITAINSIGETCVTDEYYVEAVYVPGPVSGDIDDNGVVDMSDVSMLFSYLNGGSVQLSGAGLANADANGDGVVNVMDITAIFTMIANS